MLSKFKKIIGFLMILGISALTAGCLRQAPAPRPQPKRPVRQPVEQNSQGQLPSNQGQLPSNNDGMVKDNAANTDSVQRNMNGGTNVDATLDNLDKLSNTSDTQDVDDSDIDNF